MARSDYIWGTQGPPEHLIIKLFVQAGVRVCSIYF